MWRIVAVGFFGLLISTIFADPQVVVLGFDGADPELVNKWLDELPNIKELQKNGSFLSLETTNPSHSPVAWATFATGNNPGKHKIFGFLKRTIGQYKPEYAVAKAEFFDIFPIWQRLGLSALLGSFCFVIFFLLLRKSKNRKKISIFVMITITWVSGYSFLHFIPQKIPFPIAQKQGKSFWTIAAEHNIETDVVMAPIAFPAEKVSGGHLLCGFGVPDLLGTNGTWFLFSSEYQDIDSTETGGWHFPLQRKDQKFIGKLLGPKNLLKREKHASITAKLDEITDFSEQKELRNQLAILEKDLDLSADITIEKLSSEKLRIHIQEQHQDISINNWSDWFYVNFTMSPVLSFSGGIRIHVLQIEPEVKIYVSPLQFVPNKLPLNVQLSHPKNFAAEVMQKNGMFPTLGWAAATNALKDNAISEEAFWDDLQNIIKVRQKIFTDALMQRKDLLVGVFYFTDRAAHMYWRFIDKNHPLYEENSPHKNKLLKIYKQMDEIIGITYRNLKEDDILLVVSDHGFKSFRWEVNINTWLWKNGYLQLKKENQASRMRVHDLFERTKLLQDIDWSKTKAYAVGLGKIFINMKGREPQGIVTREEYSTLREEIREKLMKFQHQGQNVLSKVYMQEDVFSGPFAHEAADIVLGFSEGYRISWQTSLGGVPKELVEENLLKWSGDHCSVDPSLVPGIFISNKKISTTTPKIGDIAPLILSIFGVENHEEMDSTGFTLEK